MGRLVSEKYAAWQAECEQRFQQLKKDEEKLMSLLVNVRTDIYKKIASNLYFLWMPHTI